MDHIEKWIACYGNFSEEDFTERFTCPFLISTAFSTSDRKINTGITTEAVNTTDTDKLPIYCLVATVRKSKEYFPGKITIGRAATNDIALDHKGISKFHAFVTYDEAKDCYCLQDAESTNGTWLNQKELGDGSFELHDRDVINLGQVIKLKFFTSSAFQSYMKFYKKWM